MIRLFGGCVPLASRTTSFDSGEFVLPFSGGAASGEPCIYKCDKYSTGPTSGGARVCVVPVAYSEAPAVPQFTYTPPATSKRGIWSVTVTAVPVAMGALPDPVPDPLYNGFITVGDGVFLCCGGGTLSPVFGSTWDGANMTQISSARDGSDAAPMSDLVFDFGFYNNGTSPCCECRSDIQIVNGAWNSDLVPYALWSWTVRITGTWVSDFPP